jgi:hypothetical protein
LEGPFLGIFQGGARKVGFPSAFILCGYPHENGGASLHRAGTLHSFTVPLKYEPIEGQDGL